MLILYTESDKETLKLNGKSFKYIYAHGGNNHKNTSGCVLVAFSKYENTIQGTAEKQLFDKVSAFIKNGDDVRWIIVNNPQIK